MLLWKSLLTLILMYSTSILFVNCGSIAQREMDLHQQEMDPKKRPFCNAFTGCGKKRSNHEPNVEIRGSEERYPVENTLSDLIDMNSEPAVQDLMRQIMSQAKLWEAIQEASREILGQKGKSNKEKNNYSIGFSTQ